MIKNYLYTQRTQEILSHPEWIANVNKRKRKNKVTVVGLNKSICCDGILNRGEFRYADGFWSRSPRGDEEERWRDSPLKILCITKDSNEGVDENAKANDAGWDICCETGRNNACTDVSIDAQFYQRFFRAVAEIVLCYNGRSMEETMQRTANMNQCRNIWEKAPLARINLKKQPGCGGIKDVLLRSYISLYKPVLEEQIVGLDATVIVNSAGKPGMELLKEIYHLERADADYGDGTSDWVYVDRGKKVVVIDTYHFSYNYANWDWERRRLECLYHYYKNRSKYGMD